MLIIDPKTGLMKGSVGNMTYYIRNGKQIVRVRHNSSHHDAKTPKQIDQRHKMSMAIGYLKPIAGFIRTSFKSVPPFEAHDRAKSHIMDNACIKVEDTSTLDYSKVLVCQGTLAPPDGATMHFNPFEQTFTFAWADNSGQACANEDDQLVFLIYDNFRGSIYSSQHMESTALRKDGTFCFKPHCLSEGNYMVYLAFRNADDTDISNSVCVGMVRC